MKGWERERGGGSKKKKSIGGVRHSEKVQKKTCGRKKKSKTCLLPDWMQIAASCRASFTCWRSRRATCPLHAAEGRTQERPLWNRIWTGKRAHQIQLQKNKTKKKEPVTGPGGRRDGSLWTLCGLFVHCEASHLTPAGQAAVIKLISFIKTRPLHNSLRVGEGGWAGWVEVNCRTKKKNLTGGRVPIPNFAPVSSFAQPKKITSECFPFFVFFSSSFAFVSDRLVPCLLQSGRGGDRGVLGGPLCTWLDDDGPAAPPLPLSVVAPGGQPALGVSL